MTNQRGNYGRVTSLALDPIEKKPISRWRPGTTVLSVGSYGCTMDCPFCQNDSIAKAGADDVAWQLVGPNELIEQALQLAGRRCIGIAYTYNEPLRGWRYVCDAGKLAHEAGLVNVLVSNGLASEKVLGEVAPLIDAANIDLKSFSSETYRTIGGDLATVQETIRLLAATSSCHLEVTTLVVPDVNDSVDEMRELAAWLASVDPDITLHVSRFFPNWRMRDRGPTPVSRVYGLAETARKYLAHVYTGNC